MSALETSSPRPTQTAAEPTTAAKPAPVRLGWLDSLRGVAALCVASYHLALPYVWTPHANSIPQYIDPGIFGVMLFFLISGYIIPASLERRGDIRGFWIGRITRIYPVLIAVIVASLLILPRAYTLIPGFAFDHPVLMLGSNSLLLQDLLGTGQVLNVMWTLTYEMVFYYLVTMLFTLRLHRHSGVIAVLFAALALLIGGTATLDVVGPGLPAARHLIAAAIVVVVLGLGGVLSGNTLLTRIGALLLGGLGLALIFLHGRAATFETMMIFATMFSGTVVYRAEQRQMNRWLAVVCCLFVVGAGFAVGPMYDFGPALGGSFSGTWMAWSYACVGAWAVFGLGMLLRKRRFPRFLTWLGAISYSVYLIHNPLVHALDWYVAGHGGLPKHTGGRIVLLLVFFGVLLLLSQLAYRLVEVPGQKLGRALLKAVNRKGREPQG